MNTTKSKTKKLVITSMLGAISAILMLFKFPLPFSPSFITMDFSELPVVLGGFILGPIYGITISFIKIFINLIMNGTTTFYVGELANFLYSVAYILPAILIYKKNKTKKNAVLGLIIGTLVATFVAITLNLIIIFPLYAKLMGVSLEDIILMVTSVNPYVKNMVSLMIFSLLPFNLFKYGLTSLITFVLYKKLSHIIKNYF